MIALISEEGIDEFRSFPCRACSFRTETPVALAVHCGRSDVCPRGRYHFLGKSFQSKTRWRFRPKAVDQSQVSFTVHEEAEVVEVETDEEDYDEI